MKPYRKRPYPTRIIYLPLLVGWILLIAALFAPPDWYLAIVSIPFTLSHLLLFLIDRKLYR